VAYLVQDSGFLVRIDDSRAGIAESCCICMQMLPERLILAATPAIDPVAEIMLSPIVCSEIQDTKV
jgi:hypothetical protein